MRNGPATPEYPTSESGKVLLMKALEQTASCVLRPPPYPLAMMKSRTGDTYKASSFRDLT